METFVFQCFFDRHRRSGYLWICKKCGACTLLILWHLLVELHIDWEVCWEDVWQLSCTYLQVLPETNSY